MANPKIIAPDLTLGFITSNLSLTVWPSSAVFQYSMGVYMLLQITFGLPVLACLPALLYGCVSWEAQILSFPELTKRKSEI